MNTLIKSLCVFGIVGATLVLISPATAGCGTDKCSVSGPKDKQGCKTECDHLKTILKSIDLAIRDLESGKNQNALAELKKTRSFVEKLQASKPAPAKKVAKAEVSSDTSKFVNDRCPIMGSPIDPKNVPDNLTRVYKGKKVAFCCGGCPGEWDKLSDQEKEAKLKASTSKK